jgi:hypothetical protein
MSPRANARPHGQIRQSQVVTTFGPGAPLDLPNYSVLVGGLEGWSQQGREEIHEPRLVAKLKRVLELPDLKLFTPPPEGDEAATQTGITVWQFPEWFIAQDVEQDKHAPTVRSRLLVHRLALTRGKFIDADKKKHSVVPIRFVRACPRGHIGDIDWYTFVHRGEEPCRRQLWIEERGTSGDLAEVFVRCECGKRRSISQATQLETRPLGVCDGARPWLGPYNKENCNEPNRLLVRHASNAYFPQIMSVISIPDRNEELAEAVSQVWEHYLQYIETIEELQKERDRKPPVRDILGDFSDAEVFSEIQARKGASGAGAQDKTVKAVELETLNASKEELGNDRPDGDFYARALPRAQWDTPMMADLERVVLVHRLREVVAQVGFTRFESTSPDIEGELELGVKRATLAREVTWLPAVENRGEGVFLSFKKDAVETWLARPEVKERGKQLLAGFNCWKEDHKDSTREFFGLPYIMLHSLSHLLITAVSLECGYPASSIRERIYATDKGYGILLYTGTPDAEGTLGGLVDVGRKIHLHMERALELGRLCSNDPVCAQHDPSNTHERRFLHGAACHGCLLIAEPSCEQRNDFLDRALVVSTVDNLGAEFFRITDT